MLTNKKPCGIITEFRDGTVLRTLKIKQRKKRNLDKNLSTKSTNQIQISETKQGKKITIASIVNERLSSRNDLSATANKYNF